MTSKTNIKGKIILYGWVISIIPLFAGLGMMEWAMETGDPVFLPGFLLFMVWIGFSLLVIRYPKEVEIERQNFDAWMDRMLEE